MSDALRTQHETPLLRQYQSLLAVSEAIAAERDLSSLFQHLAKHLRAVVAFDAVASILHDPAHNLMCVQMRESMAAENAPLPPGLPIESSPSGWVMQAQQPLIIPDIELEDRFPELVKLARQSGLRSYCILPLTVAGRQLGALGFGRVQSSAFAEADLEFLQQVANQVAIAIDNATNFDNAQTAEAELTRKLQQIQSLLEVNNGVVSHLDLRELFNAIVSCLRRIFPHDAAGMTLYDPTRQQLRLLALDISLPGGNILEENEFVPLTDTPAGLAFESRQTLIVNRSKLEQFSSPLVQRVLASGVQSGLLAPLIAHGRVLGTIDLASVQDNAFSAEHAELLTQIAGQIAIAVANAINYEEAVAAQQQLKYERDRSQFLLELNRAVTSTLDLQELIDAISPCLRRVVHHDFAALNIYDSESGQLRAHALDFPEHRKKEGMLFPMEGTPSGLAFQTRQIVFVDSQQLERFGTTPLIKILRADGVQSGCTLPLLVQDRVVGVLSLMSLHKDTFDNPDPELLKQIAAHLAIAVENALNYERACKAEQEVKLQLERERLMLEINNAVVTELDLRELVRMIFACLRKVLPLNVVGISLYDAEADCLRAYFYDLPETMPPIESGTEIPLGNSIGGLAFTSGKPVFFNHPDQSRANSTFNQRLMAGGTKSGGCVPLIVRGRKLGVLGVASFEEDVFPEPVVELLAQITDQISIAVENALNFERARKAEQEATRQSEHLSLVLQINNAVVSHLNLHDLLQVISRSLREAVHNDTTGIALYDPECNQLRMMMTDFPEQMELVKENYLIPLEDSVMGLAFTSGQPVFLDEFDLEKFPSEFTKRSYEAGLRSCGNIPLIAHGRKLGALGVASKRPSAFSAEDLELICQSANQIAIAVENALNYERAWKAEQEVTRQLERERLMLEINNAVVTQLDLRELARVTASRLRELLQHAITGISLYDPETNQFRAYMFDLPENMPAIPEGTPMPLEGTVGGVAFLSGRPVFMNRYEPEFLASEFDKRLIDAGIKSGGVIPLITHERKLGFLGVGSFRENAFSEADQELLCHIANQIAIAVDNALNFERTRAAEEEAKRHSERRQLLLQINNAVVSHLDLHSLIKSISACLREVLQHDVTGIALYDPDTNQLRACAYESFDKQFAIEEGTLIPLEGSLTGSAFITGQPFFHDRIDEQRFQSTFSKRFRAAGLNSGGVVPLIAHNRKLGTLAVASYREASLSEDKKELLCQVASQVAIAVENALAFREIETLKNKLASEKLYLEDEIRTEHNFEELIGASRAFKRILKQIETVAPTDSTVLIRGETGTGKELIARAIHNLSGRRERTLVKLNCAAIPTGLLESELFGHEKGAFTGAISQRIGRFELANHGTLLLDEIGDIPVELQPKLLRVLQEQEFERLGSTRTQKVNVRLIAATNADLEQLVAEKKYRSDLYYRLNVFPVTIPPLRERAEDIPLLVRFFTRKYARRMKKPVEAIPAEAMEALTAYHWPGNVRELEHFIERAVVLTQGSALEVSQSELKPAPKSVVMSVHANSTSGASPIATLEAAEREHILHALEETNWVIGGPQGAAARLGMKRTTLQSRMQKLGITR